MRHIIVTGASGAGKTVASLKIAEELSLRAVHMDDDEVWRRYLREKPASFYAGNRTPGSRAYAEYQAVRTDVVVRTLSKLKEPCVVEGSQALACPDLLKEHVTVLMYLPPSVNVRQRLSRDVQKGRLSGFDDPRCDARRELAVMLYLEAGREMIRLADRLHEQEVWTINDVEDVRVVLDVMLPISLCGKPLCV